MCRYTGVLCSSWVPGQFFWGSTCDTACAEIEPQGVTTALGIMAVVLVWYLINTQSSDVLDLLLRYVALLLARLCGRCSLRAWFSLFSYMQLQSVIFDFESAYPHGSAWNGAWSQIAMLFGAPAPGPLDFTVRFLRCGLPVAP